VYRRPAFFALLVAAMVLGAPTGFAAPRDAAATKKIDEAINNLYLATQFDKAEALLKGVIDACEDRCSPQVKGRAWMYIGIVRGSGKQDLGGAQEAFSQAVALDPSVKLDDALATPQTHQAFAAATGAPAPAAATKAAPATEAPAAAGAGGAVPGNMECTPNVKEVEAQRPIPVACTTDEPAVKVTLRYMPFGGETWQQVTMTKKGEYWQGEIPCADTGVNGKLKFYVQAKDKDGEELDSFGSKKQASEIQIVGRTDAEPPSYPGQAAPAKCMDASACPEDMIGTPACPGTKKSSKGSGTLCESTSDCDSGLFCLPNDSGGRTCQSAPSCETAADCPSGAACTNGTCDVENMSAPFKKNWLGLHFAADFAFLSGSNVCTRGSSFDCYYAGGHPYTGTPVQNQGGNLNGGAAPGTVRLLLSYERVIWRNLAGEVRAGFAFNGGPKAPDGTSFLPIHLELRAKYWFGRDVFSKKGFRPYGYLGGGIAQVDAKLTVTVYDPVSNPAQPTPQLDAYRKFGQSFISFGVGAMYAFAPTHGLVLNVGAMYLFPASGLVLEPTLGYEIGF